MKIKNQKGFTVVEGLIILVFVAVIAGAGWYVWHVHNKPKTDTNSSDNITKQLPPTPNPSPQTVSLKTYTNTDYGFSFKYPENWKLATDLKDLGRGIPEGKISVTSPNGTVVHFDPDLGGKGGDCVDPKTNTRTTRSCTTTNYYSVKQLTNSGRVKAWFIQASATEPTEIGGKTHYYVLDSSSAYSKYGQLVPPTVGSTLGVSLGTYDDVFLTKGYVGVSVTGKGDSLNSSKAFFSSNEVKEATPVMQSLHTN